MRWMAPIFIKAERGPRMDLRKRTSRPEQKNEQQQKTKQREIGQMENGLPKRMRNSSKTLGNKPFS